jgi:uncharacterized protein YjcR
VKKRNSKRFTDIFSEKKEIVYVEKNVQDVITKYSVMCCGKYKQFEEKLDFIVHLLSSIYKFV